MLIVNLVDDILIHNSVRWRLSLQMVELCKEQISKSQTILVFVTYFDHVCG